MTDKTLLDELDRLLAAQGRLMFAKNAYDEEEATNFGVSILDFMRKHGIELRTIVAAELARESVGDGDDWLPIDTAPKDGSMYLCWVDAIRYGERDDGSLDQADVSEVDFGQWREFESGGAHINMMGDIGDGQQITHWQPLPQRPNQTITAWNTRAREVGDSRSVGGDVERDARTLLAAEYERDGWEQKAYAVRSGWKSADAEPALRAIISALAGVSEGKEKP